MQNQLSSYYIDVTLSVLHCSWQISYDICIDQQAAWVLPAAGPEREAGERQEEDGTKTSVHASGVLGTHSHHCV